MQYQNKLKILFGRLRLCFGAMLLFCIVACAEAFAGVGNGRYFVLRQSGPEITSVENHALGEGIDSKIFYAGVTDENNRKWFLTDAGVVSGPPFAAVITHSGIPL